MRKGSLLLVIATLLIVLASIVLHVARLPLLRDIVAETSRWQEDTGRTQTSITLKGNSPLKGEYVCFWFSGILEGPQGTPRDDALHLGCRGGVWECPLSDPPPKFPLVLQVNRCPDTLRWWERILPIQRSQIVRIPEPDRAAALENILPGPGIWTVTTDQALAREFGKVQN